MRKLVLLVVAVVLSFPSALLAQTGGAMAAPHAAQAGQMSNNESHPEIHAAMEHLRQAKGILQKRAAHDFEGHRKQAIESIEQAQEHLREALTEDKK